MPLPTQHRMPQHPTRHDAPAQHIGTLTRRSEDRSTTGHTGSLANVHIVARARVPVPELQRHRLPPVAQAIRSAEPPVIVMVSVSFSLGLSQRASVRAPEHRSPEERIFRCTVGGPRTFVQGC
jgi:hypothetical protein